MEKLIKLEKGMKYMPSAYFFENLYRKLRFKYPTAIFDEASFKILLILSYCIKAN